MIAAVKGPALLFYDGTCGLCHRAVVFALRRDPRGELFRFAPLGGETFVTEIPSDQRATLPDSLVLLDEEGLHVRSEAALRVASRLGAPWPFLARLVRPLPRSWRDSLYDTIARWRARLFARPAEACPWVPDSLKGRFLP